MIYQCKAGHKFLWAAVVTEHTTKNVVVNLNVDEKEFVTDWFEVVSHRCPVEGCGSIEISEYIEPAEVVESLVSVPHSEVNAKIAEGYQVKSIYVKETVLVKVKKL